MLSARRRNKTSSLGEGSLVQFIVYCNDRIMCCFRERRQTKLLPPIPLYSHRTLITPLDGVVEVHIPHCSVMFNEETEAYSLKKTKSAFRVRIIHLPSAAKGETDTAVLWWNTVCECVGGGNGWCRLVVKETDDEGKDLTWTHSPTMDMSVCSHMKSYWGHDELWSW